MIFLALTTALMSVGNFAIRKLFATSDDLTRQFLRKIVDIVSLIPASWIMGNLEGRTLADYGLPWRQALGTRFWQGAGIGFAAVTTLLASMRAVGVFHLSGPVLHDAAAWKWAGLYAAAFIVVGLQEEFKFRGYALFTLSTGMSFWPSAVLLSSLFGIGHISNHGETWIGALNAAMGGLLFAALLRRSGSLWLPIGMHAGWDWAQSYFYGVADSGINVPGHLFESSFSGSVWLTGGSVGPEGSFLCTLVLIVIWLVSSAILREARYPIPAARQPA